MMESNRLLATFIMGACFSTSQQKQTLQSSLQQQDSAFSLIAGYIRKISYGLASCDFAHIQFVILMFYPAKGLSLQPDAAYLSQQLGKHKPNKLTDNIPVKSYSDIPEQTCLLCHACQPNAMPHQPSQQQLQMVLDHYVIAQNKDMEQILFENEPHVLQFRDKIYLKAQQNGINCTSNDDLRLKILGTVIEYTFKNIQPPNKYTEETDRTHFTEVAAFSAKFCENQNLEVPLTLICAAWCHDIERFIPSTKCKYLPEVVDKYRKQVIHPITSAKIARVLFKGGPITTPEIDRICELIVRHDLPDPRKDIIILSELLVSKASEDLLWELECLMDGDAFAFFESTISSFITFKSNKNSPDWIWERVRTNIKRLRPYLRAKAVECITNLSPDLLCKMSVNYDELNCLCFPNSISK